MKSLSLTLAALLVASPALAHPGGHMHPHGIGTVVALGLGAAAFWGLVSLGKARFS
ncbi:peptidase M23 [Thioclava atlantica]|uniref:Uncharacterized protein n=1 Tax=Thioclava atlantica TaxID=1317124 RepID=A0A085TZR7_9RHOB|nr:peptidase M23 [Thioclava atlantica]KFE36214.1 hypothetical protein DW2_02849 [Thioclava atlantica]